MDSLGPKKRSLAALLAWIAIAVLILCSQEARNWSLLLVLAGGVYAFIRGLRAQHQNLLHPEPREYPMSPRLAFMRIRDLLAETSYGIGDTWHVAVADTQAGRIVAHLRYCDERTFIEGDGYGHVHVRKERHKRFLTLQVLIEEKSAGAVAIHLDFEPKADDGNVLDCHRIVASTHSAIDTALRIA